MRTTLKQKFNCGVVMVNYTCQVGWATVARYLVKYSGCFCEGVFLDEINI